MDRVITQIEYAKMKDGTWGLKGPLPPPEPGASVTVHKKDGKTRAERFERVVWRGDGIWIGKIVPREGMEASSSAPRSSTNAPPRRVFTPKPPVHRPPPSGGDYECPACGEHVHGSSTCPATGNPH